MRLIALAMLLAQPAAAAVLRGKPAAAATPAAAAAKPAAAAAKPAAAAAKPAAAAVLHSKQQPLVVNGGEMVVEVPVIEVVMVGDGAGDIPQLRQAPLSPEQKLHMECEKEMFLMMMNRTRMEGSQKCEQSAGHVNHSIVALQHGDTKAATASVIHTFVDCASMSTKCAQAMAPDVVQKMRLSGVTVDHKCELEAKHLHDEDGTRKPAKNATVACEKNTVLKMIGGLQHEDVDAAMSEAQQGLKSCNSISSPCDFQLAPMLVTQIVDEHEEQEEAHALKALFAGLRKAQQVQAKMSATTSSKEGTKKGHKVPLSLVSLATSTRVASTSHIMKF